MPTFITLLRWTEQGVKNIKDSPSRVDQAREALKAVGGERREFYLTLGPYDAVAICEAPNGKAYAQFAQTVASKRNGQSETLRSFTEEQYRVVIAQLPGAGNRPRGGNEGDGLQARACGSD